MSLHFERPSVRGRRSLSTNSWLPSWWRSKDGLKRGLPSASSSDCDCTGLIQLNVGGFKDPMNEPVFTTHVSPVFISPTFFTGSVVGSNGVDSNNDFLRGNGHEGAGDDNGVGVGVDFDDMRKDKSISRELQVTHLTRSPFVGAGAAVGLQLQHDDHVDYEDDIKSLGSSSYDLCHSSSMTPLIPVSTSTTRKEKRKSKLPEATQEQQRVETFRTNETPETELAEVTETLLDLQPAAQDSLENQQDFDASYYAETSQNDYSLTPTSSPTPPSSSSASSATSWPNSLRVSAGNFFGRLSNKSSTSSATMVSTDPASLQFNREEMLRMFMLKLEEESNYFDSSPSPDEELCQCLKCQAYYGEYYARYLEEYQRYGDQLTAATSGGIKGDESVEISILMGDLMNNGSSGCAIM